MSAREANILTISAFFFEYFIRCHKKSRAQFHSVSKRFFFCWTLESFSHHHRRGPIIAHIAISLREIYGSITFFNTPREISFPCRYRRATQNFSAESSTLNFAFCGINLNVKKFPPEWMWCDEKRSFNRPNAWSPLCRLGLHLHELNTTFSAWLQLRVRSGIWVVNNARSCWIPVESL